MIELKKNQSVILATHNDKKLQEMQACFASLPINIVSAKDYDLPKPEENGNSFAQNALIKAKTAALATNMPAIADDSGLCVCALNDEPGIYSARWAKKYQNYMGAMQAIWEKIENTGNFAAYFICSIALVLPNNEQELYLGRIDGTITWPAKGSNGMGYDPFFVPNGFDKTFAQMSAAEKQAISHRHLAIAKLIDDINIVT